MTNDWKLILNVVLGSAALILVVIFGLSKMAGTGTTLTADQNLLVNGAKLVKENGETKVTVVNFSDMECPACKKTHEQLAGLNSLVGVKMIFRYFPLGIHKNGLISVRAVEAARQMGKSVNSADKSTNSADKSTNSADKSTNSADKGWEMIDLLFSKQSEWSGNPNIEDLLVGYARDLGLDEVVFKEKLNSTEVATAVQQDIALGNSLRLSGTPTIYVNGEQVAADFVVAKVTQLLK